MHFEQSPIRLLCLGLSAVFAVAFGFLVCDSGQALLVVRHAGYWLVLLPFLLLCWNLAAFFREERGVGVFRSGGGAVAWGRRFLWPALYVLASSLVLLSSQPSGFKIVMDELVLAATSLQMHLAKEANAVIEASEIEGVFHLLNGILDKRPLFFPFLLSLMHDLTGYRPLQGVVLNALLTPVFLGLMFVVGNHFRRRSGGYLAVALWATVPLFAMTATSAGFDLLNLVLILATVVAGYAYLERPDFRRMNILVLLGVLLAQTRYESVLFVFAVAALILGVWWREKRVRISWTLVLAPLLLVTYPLQRLIMNEYEQFWQLREAGGSPFAAGFVMENLGHAWDFFFSFGTQQPNSWLVSAFFILALVLLCFPLLKGRAMPFPNLSSARVFAVFGGVILVNFFLLMAYHWGQMDDIMASRLALPFILLQVTVIVLVAGRLLPLSGRRAGWLLGCVLLFFVFFTRPQMARTDYLPWTLKNEHLAFLDEVAEEMEGSNPLMISEPSLSWILNLKSGILADAALNFPERLELHQRLRTFDGMYVVYLLPTQRARVEQHQFLALSARLKADYQKTFELEKVREEKINDACYIRLSRIQSVRVPPGKRIELDAGPINVNYTGKMLFEQPAAIRQFVQSLPKSPNSQ